MRVDIKLKKSSQFTQKERQYRREASRLVSLANKRLNEFLPPKEYTLFDLMG